MLYSTVVRLWLIQGYSNLLTGLSRSYALLFETLFTLCTPLQRLLEGTRWRFIYYTLARHTRFVGGSILYRGSLILACILYINDSGYMVFSSKLKTG